MGIMTYDVDLRLSLELDVVPVTPLPLFASPCVWLMILLLATVAGEGDDATGVGAAVSAEEDGLLLLLSLLLPPEMSENDEVMSILLRFFFSLRLAQAACLAEVMKVSCLLGLCEAGEDAAPLLPAVTTSKAPSEDACMTSEAGEGAPPWLLLSDNRLELMHRWSQYVLEQEGCSLSGDSLLEEDNCQET